MRHDRISASGGGVEEPQPRKRPPVHRRRVVVGQAGFHALQAAVSHRTATKVANSLRRGYTDQHVHRRTLWRLVD